MKKILVLNGPNINMTGKREPDKYGTMSLDDINKILAEKGKSAGAEIEFFQSNSEGAIIDEIHSAMGKYDGVVINAGAYTHYSYAIRDAISSVNVPFVEVHMTNVHKREEFRHKSTISAVCEGVICGFGYKSYILAIEFLAEK